MSASHDTPHRRRQRGSSLLAVTAGLALASVTIVGGLAAARVQQKASEGRAIGENIRHINNALGQYLVTHYETLIALPTACSEVSYAAGTSLGGARRADLAACAFTVAGYRVANGMQPSIADLRGLKLLDASVSGDLKLPYAQVVAEHDADSGERSATPTAGRLATRVWHVCVPDAPARPASPAPCAGQGVDLQALVFNTQPYFLGNGRDFAFGQGAQMGAVIQALGGDGAVTRPASHPGGELVGYLEQFTLPNPVRAANTPEAAGMAGIIGARSGYGSSGWSQFARRDGSNLPTADWDFNNKNITNLAGLNVNQHVRVGGAVVAQGNVSAWDVQARGGVYSDHDVVAGGNMAAAGGITSGGAVRAVGDVVSDATVSGATLKARGNLYVDGASMLNKASATQLKIQSAARGDACDPTAANIAVAADNTQVLFCNSATRVWEGRSGQYIDTSDRWDVTIDPRNFNCSMTHSRTREVRLVRGASAIGQCNMHGIQGGNTGLKTDEWFPVVMSYRHERQRDIKRQASGFEFWTNACGANFWCVSALIHNGEVYTGDDGSYVNWSLFRLRSMN